MSVAALDRSPARPDVTPRPPSLIERAIGALIAAVPTAAIVVPVLVDPHDGGPLGTIVTPVLVAVPVLVGALIAGGPRGRARLAAAIFGSDRRYINGRQYILTTENTDRLARLGRALGMVLVLGAGALVCFAKPIVTPHLDRGYVDAPSPSSAFPPIPARMRAELEAAAAAGDPEAIQVLRMIAPPRSEGAGGEHFTLAGYTSERNVAWPLTGGALLLVALALVLTRGGLSQPEAGAGR